MPIKISGLNSSNYSSRGLNSSDLDIDVEEVELDQEDEVQLPRGNGNMDHVAELGAGSKNSHDWET